jgi:hypothetical protein
VDDPDRPATLLGVALLAKYRGTHRTANVGTECVARSGLPSAPAAPTPTIEASSEAVVSYNQSGGITARNVHLRPPQRTIAPGARERMLVIFHARPSKIGIAVAQGNAEAERFQAQLMSVFRDAGWQVEPAGLFMSFDSTRGLLLWVPPGTSGPDEDGVSRTAAQALVAGGHSLTWNYVR